MGWQQDAEDAQRAAECALKREARSAWAEFVGELMPWSVIVNPATFDPLEMAGAAPGQLAAEARPLASVDAPTRLASFGSSTGAAGRAEVSPRQLDALPPRISPATALRRLGFFVNRAREELQRPVEGFMAIEAGDAWGQLHGHGLLAVSGGLRDGDVSRLSRFWRGYPLNGFIRLELPRSIEDVIAYATKHTVKQLGDVVFSWGCGRQFYEGWGPLPGPE